jgi:hypothetical protein
MTKRNEDGFRRLGAAPGRDGRGATLKLFVAGGFALLATAALAVVFLLPDRVAEPPAQPTAASATMPAAGPPPVQARAPSPPPSAVPTGPLPSTAAPPAAGAAPDAHRGEAEKLLTEALRRLAELESVGVRVWGGTTVRTSLPEAEASLGRANAHHDRGDYAAALPLFRDAIDRLGQLAESRPERFRQAMEDGLSAYGRKDAAAAAVAFEIASAIARDSDEARTALDRAKRLPDVLAKMATGEEREREGDLDRALDLYLAALSVDGAYGPAKQNADRVGALIADRNYRRSVSAALDALDHGAFRAAATALREARIVRPGGAELKDISIRLAAAEQQAELVRLRDRGAALEREEKWPEAAATYRRALAIDGAAAFAARGLPRAEDRKRLHDAIDRYLADPSRLQSPEPMADAKALLAQSESLAGNAPLLDGKRGRLAALVAAADRPVAIRLTSDGQTEVQVYRVAALGRFTERSLELRPGTYTVVGFRPGYRDVRLTLTVAPGTSPAPLAVRCTEAIAK